MTPKEVIALCRSANAKAVDLRFVDFFGRWSHTTIPAAQFQESIFEVGLGFDGSSVAGWQGVAESDMLLIPEPDTTFVDPFTELPTLNIICNIVDPITHENYSRDPRFVARKAMAYLQNTGIADTAYFGPEAEFFILDRVRFDQRPDAAFFYLESSEAEWARGLAEGQGRGYQIPMKRGYLPCGPMDQTMDLRNSMMQTMIECGLPVECQHHEAATAGQAEIDLKFGTLVEMADKMMLYKYIVKNVAWNHDKTATFMPKPIYGDAGSGMHTHLSLWKDDKPLFAGEGYAGLSQMAMYAMGGILKHAPAVLAFTNPSTNSYKRLVPGYEAPINLAFSQRNRSAACRIPMYSNDPGSKRIEFRCPDGSSNPYLAFPAILMAALDGIENKTDPGPPLDKDIYDLPPEELSQVSQTPRTLQQALDALEQDHEFLLRGDVFTKDVIDTWIRSKQADDVDVVERQPTPQEFCLYYDV